MLAGTIAKTIKMSQPIILGIAGGTGAVSMACRPLHGMFSIDQSL